VTERYCYNCEEDLTPENTASYKGFDKDNYEMSLIYTGGQMSKEAFTKCDPCFDRDIDNYLENLYN
jgi:hypothetical protein